MHHKLSVVELFVCVCHCGGGLLHGTHILQPRCNERVLSLGQRGTPLLMNPVPRPGAEAFCAL